MFGILSRRLKTSLPSDGVIRSKPTSNLGFLSISFSSFGAVVLEKFEKALPFIVSYLVNSCGLSLNNAIVASYKIKLQNSEKAYFVMAFFSEHEFLDTHISKFIRKRPNLLLSDPKRIILSKLEYFYSKGFSKEDTVQILSSNPLLLYKSLNKHIIPTYNLLKSVISILRDLGLSNSSIASTLQHFSEILVLKPEWFRNVVDKVKDMGFQFEKFTFLFVMHALAMKNFETIWR